jgi:hypothetical protein
MFNPEETRSSKITLYFSFFFEEASHIIQIHMHPIISFINDLDPVSCLTVNSDKMKENIAAVRAHLRR